MPYPVPRPRSCAATLMLLALAIPGLEGQMGALSTRATNPTPATAAATPDPCARAPTEVADKIRDIDNNYFWIWWPARYDRHGARCIYSQVSPFRALSALEGDIRDDQQVLTTEVISGLIGALPFAIQGVFVVSREARDSVMTDSGPEFVEGIASRLAALTRNGGNVSLDLTLPVGLLGGPTVRWTQGLNFELGVLGNVTEVDNLDGSYSSTLAGSFAFTVRNTADDVLGAVLLPYRVGWVGVFGDLDEATPALSDNGFWLAQAGLGLTDGDGNLRGGVTVTWPLATKVVREIVPRFTLDLRLALPPKTS